MKWVRKLTRKLTEQLILVFKLAKNGEKSGFNEIHIYQTFDGPYDTYLLHVNAAFPALFKSRNLMIPIVSSGGRSLIVNWLIVSE